MTTLSGEVTNRSAAPGQSRWVVVLAAFLFVGVGAGVLMSRLWPHLSTEIPDRALGADEKDAVFECMQQALLHEDAARACVMTYGWQALPYYHAVIQDSEERSRVRANASMLAGLYHDPSSSPFIIDFLESIVSDDMSSTHLSAAATALDGLGFAGDPVAVSYLSSLATGSRWEDEASEEEAVRVRRILQKRGIRALGLVPAGEGIESLETILTAMPELSDAVEAALSDANRRRLGLNRVDALR